jgi:fructokinase
VARLGEAAALVSRVGPDERGLAAMARVGELGVGSRCLQQDYALPTGEARAVLAADGSARYEFETPAAWDAIEFDESVRHLVASSAALVFGSLAQRDRRSREALRQCVTLASYRVFDVNLRQPHHDAQAVRASLREADFVKLNEEECAIVGGWLDTSAEPDQLRIGIERLRTGRKDHALQLCITRGGEGAMLWSGDRWHSQPAVPVQVADTVGAGDSFLAMLLAQRLRGVAPQLALERAAALGSFVASRAGAVPDYDPRQLFPDCA